MDDVTEPVRREPAPEDVEKLVKLLRRTLVRLSSIEKRLGVVEARLHDLEDLPEAVQGLERLAGRAVMTDERVRTIANNALDKKMRKRQSA